MFATTGGYYLSPPYNNHHFLRFKVELSDTATSCPDDCSKEYIRQRNNIAWGDGAAEGC
jgi:hypothetical protein